jgi:hypothetical protein
VTRSSWSRGGGGSGQSEVFRRQAAHFTLLGSPVYGRLAGQLARDPRPALPVIGEGASWDLGLRLFGAVHHHVLTGVAPLALSGHWGDFAGALDEHEASLRRSDEREADHDDRYELELRLWPEPARLVAFVDFHGNWVDWVGT